MAQPHHEATHVDDANLLAQRDRVLSQAALACRDKDMARQELVANTRRKWDDYGMRAVRIGAVGLNDEDRTHARLFGAARQR
jgi:hypothetical protein